MIHSPMGFDNAQDGTLERLAQTADLMALSLFFMQHPKILGVERRAGDESRQARRARERVGGKPKTDYGFVTIHLTKREQEARATAAEHEQKTGRRLHYVRPFIRTRRGKIEMVREHWRGNASLGTKQQPIYRVVP